MRGPNGGPSAGVAVLSRSHLGCELTESLHDHLAAQGYAIPPRERFIGSNIEAGMPCGLVVASLYLVDSIGYTAENIRILEAVRTYLLALGRPFIGAMDANMTAQTLIALPL